MTNTSTDDSAGQVPGVDPEEAASKDTGKPQQPTSTPTARVHRLPRFWHGMIEILSSEWLLTCLRLPNGGSIIFLRSLLTSLYVYLFILGLRNLLDPTRIWAFSPLELRVQLLGTMHWFGAVFAATYTALYTRFASQWTYLSNLYNQIKAAECREQCNASVLAEWKAGFIEDAEELHLATKPLFASVLREWGRDNEVRKKFVKYSGDGEQQFLKLMERVETVWQETATRAR